MIALVTKQQAADHLRIDDVSPELDDLYLKILAASAAVLNYVEMDEDDFFDSDSDGELEIPFVMQAATLLLVGDLYAHRDSGSKEYTEANLPAPVRALLYPLKTFGL